MPTPKETEMPELFDALSLIAARHVAEERAGSRIDVPGSAETPTRTVPQRRADDRRGTASSPPGTVRGLRRLGWGR